MDSTPLIIVIVILIAMSAFFSATETAFSSCNRIRLKNMANGGKKMAKLALKLSENYDTLLSTILVGNNIVNIASTSIATVVFTNYLGDMGVTISTIVMTVVVLIFGEISPKSIAKEKAESFAILSAPVLQVFVWILTPVNLLFKWWKMLLSKVFHLQRNDTFTEEELITIVDEVQSDGVFDQHEGALIRSAIEFNDLDVEDILIPRVDVIAVEKNASMQEVTAMFREHGYSRMPVYEEDIDHIIGIIHEKDFNRSLSDDVGDLSSIIKNATIVTKGMKISKLLRLLQYNKTHLAVVVDEFGGTVGIVTLEDILEELVGEIWDEYDEVVEEFVKNPDGSYSISCNANLDKMLELFQIEQEYDSSTVNGWVMEELGKVPEIGDTFTYQNLSVTVTKAEFRRAIEIHVVIREPEAPAAPESKNKS